MADGPWTKYQAASTPSEGPWTKYQTAPASVPKPEFEEWPINKALDPVNVAKNIVPPVVNFLDAPIRDLSARVVGAWPKSLGGKGAIPIDDASRKEFYREYEKSLPFAEIPETRAGHAISDIAAFPGKVIGSGVSGLSKALIGDKATEAIGPYAGAAADVLPFAGGKLAQSRAAGGLPASMVPRAAAVEARAAGYKLPPEEIMDKPTLASRVLSGDSGKVKKQQQFSQENQARSTELGATAIGLPANAKLTTAAFDNVRKTAGAAYQQVVNAIPQVVANPTYDAAVANLGAARRQLAQHFPQIMASPELDKLVTDLHAARQIPTRSAVDLVKELRHDGNSNLKARDDPSKLALGMAQRHAADAMDQLIEDNVVASGANPALVAQYKAARQLIAKTYDVEAATNPATGEIKASRVSGLRASGRPLTGELKSIADAYDAFPKQMQLPSSFGHLEDWSVLDLIGAAAAAGSGHLGAATVIAGRVPGRRFLTTDYMQDRMFNRSPAMTSPAKTAVGAEFANPPHEDDPVARALR